MFEDTDDSTFRDLFFLYPENNFTWFSHSVFFPRKLAQEVRVRLKCLHFILVLNSFRLKSFGFPEEFIFFILQLYTSPDAVRVNESKPENQHEYQNAEQEGPSPA